jgi:hypothetical protein
VGRPVKTFATICAVGFVAFLAIQFIRPDISHPPVTADLSAPPQVKQILRKSCYDCHSNETRLAWFDQIVPAYWVVANDVKAARSRLNFSEIGKLPPAQQKGTLYEAVNQIQLDAMPLPPVEHPEDLPESPGAAKSRALKRPWGGRRTVRKMDSWEQPGAHGFTSAERY